MGEAAEPLGPDSLIWRLGFRRTGLLVGGRALLLQVSHPTIGAGVRDHSDFAADPWGRLDRTLGSLQLQLLGGQQSVTEARRLRQLHKSINGTGFHGERYHALQPEAYAWVHMANLDTLMVFQRWFGHRLSPARQRQLFDEFRQVGLMLGIRESDMPADQAGLGEYLDDMVATRLADNQTVRVLLESLSLRDVPPPWRLFPAPLWTALRPFGRAVLRDVTVGTLPPALRRKLDLRWEPADQRRLERLAAAVRAASPLVPDRLLHYPLGYRAMRAARSHQSSRGRRTGRVPG
jgi:uncharacterized protein (DUF2236 family)